MLAALIEIRMGKFQEGRQDVGVRDALGREVAVGIEFGRDEHGGPDHRADARQQVPLAIVIALRHHRAVQAEHDGINRKSRAELRKDLVPQILISGALQKAAGFGPGRGAFDEVDAVGGSTPAQHHHGRGA